MSTENIDALAEETGKRQSQADVLIGIAAEAVLFHTPAPDCDSFADVTVNGHRETYRVRSTRFRNWLRHKYFNLKKGGVNSDAMKTAVETIAAKAMFEGATQEVHVRLAEYAGKVYLDLGDESWCAIEVTPNKWKVTADPPVRFQRPPSIRPLAFPARGGSIELLRPFCNLDAAGFILFVRYYSRACAPIATIPSWSSPGNRAAANPR